MVSVSGSTKFRGVKAADIDGRTPARGADGRRSRRLTPRNFVLPSVDGHRAVDARLTGGRGGIEALLEAHQVDASGLEGVNGLEQLSQ